MARTLIMVMVFALTVMLVAQTSAQSHSPAAGINARQTVLACLDTTGITLGHDRERDSVVVVVDGTLETVNPAADSGFIRKRQALRSAVYREGVEKICGFLRVESDLKRQSSLETLSSSMKSESTAQIHPQVTLYGSKVLTEAEGFDGKCYSVAMAVVWSRKLQQGAVDVLCGEVKSAASSSGGDGIDAWMARRDWSMAVGPMSTMDDQGNWHFIGIGVTEVSEKSSQNVILRNQARMLAIENLLVPFNCAVMSCTQLRVDCQRSRDQNLKSIETMNDVHYTHQMLMTSKIDMRGVREIMTRKFKCPISGKEIFISAYELCAESVKQTRGMSMAGNGDRMSNEF